MSINDTLEQAYRVKKALLNFYNDKPIMEPGKFYYLKAAESDSGYSVYVESRFLGGYSRSRVCTEFAVKDLARAKKEKEKLSEYLECEIVPLSKAVIDNLRELSGMIYSMEIQGALEDDENQID